MTYLLIFFLLVAGALGFYHLWGITHAVVFLLFGLIVEGSAYWWASHSNEKDDSK